jgi:hypothetical protein
MMRQRARRAGANADCIPKGVRARDLWAAATAVQIRRDEAILPSAVGKGRAQIAKNNKTKTRKNFGLGVSLWN